MVALDVLQMISEGEGPLRRAVETADERLETEEDADPMDSYRLIAALSEVPDILLASAHSSHSYRSGTNLYITFAVRPEKPEWKHSSQPLPMKTLPSSN